jgi:hypothetical protein
MTDGHVGGSEINLDELGDHAKKLDELAARIEQANQATLQTMHPEAFGLLGIPLAAIALVGGVIASESVQSAAGGAVDHADRVREWRDRRDWVEQEFVNEFTVED